MNLLKPRRDRRSWIIGLSVWGALLLVAALAIAARPHENAPSQKDRDLQFLLWSAKRPTSEVLAERKADSLADAAAHPDAFVAPTAMVTCGDSDQAVRLNAKLSQGWKIDELSDEALYADIQTVGCDRIILKRGMRFVVGRTKNPEVRRLRVVTYDGAVVDGGFVVWAPARILGAFAQ